MKFHILIGVPCLVFLAACSSEQQADPERSSNVVTLESTAPGLDVYASAIPTDGGVSQAPLAEKSDSNSQGSFNANNPTCDMAAELLLEYSAFQKDESHAAIDRVIEASLVYVAENTDLPPTGEKKILIQCDARVHWDAGYKSDLQYYILLDSNGDLRVRWDGIENVTEG